MSIFQFSLAQIPAAVSAILGFIANNPILCGALFLSYALFYAYAFIHNKAVDSDIYEVDLISSGVSSIMVALLLIGIDESSKSLGFSLDLGSPKGKVAVFLLAYAAVMIFMAFTKMLPGFLVVIFGNSELDLFVNFVAILMIEPSIAITGTLLAVIGVPLILLLAIQRLRRLAH